MSIRYSLTRRMSGGLTLVELLVVVTILVMLVGVVLPLASPALKGREIREAARQVNAVFAAARTRAIAEGRPVGVALLPNPNNPNQCFQLAFAKVPLPFSGLDSTWRARVGNPVAGYPNRFELEFMYVGPSMDYESISAAQAVTVNRILNKNFDDKFFIRFDFRGPYYEAGKYFVDLPALVPPGSDVVPGLPFQITRSPQRSAAAAVDLPVGAYIDLRASGLGGTNFTDGVDNNGPIFLMFNPDGSMDKIYFYDDMPPNSPTPQVVGIRDELFLLIGNQKVAGLVDGSGTPTSDTSVAVGFPNLVSTAGSMWAIVSSRTGVVRTADNLGYPPTQFAAGTADARLNVARQTALSSPNAGGR